MKKKKKLVPNSVHTWPGQENSEKNRKKRIIKLKNHFTALYLFKTGGGRPRKRGKNFNPEFHSHSTWARKFQTKLQKYSKNKKT